MTEMVVQQLLLEAGAEGVDPDLVSVDPQGFEVAADWQTLRTPETYVGFGRSAGFASPGRGAIRRAARVPRASTTRPQRVGAVGDVDARASTPPC